MRAPQPQPTIKYHQSGSGGRTAAARVQMRTLTARAWPPSVTLPLLLSAYTSRYTSAVKSTVFSRYNRYITVTLKVQYKGR